MHLTPQRIIRSLLRRYRHFCLPQIASLESVESHLQPHTRVVSFDCFDTLIRRSIDPPDAVIRRWATLVADHIAQLDNPLDESAILAIREESCAALRSAAKDKDNEFTLLELHNCIAKKIGIDPFILLSLEESLERSIISAMPHAIQLLANLRKRGLSIVVVSDMYWEEDRLHHLLNDLGITQSNDLVFVSGSQGASKRTGRLFEIVTQKLKCKPEEILHIGDHPESDAVIPKRLSIPALWFKDPAEHQRRRQLRAISGSQPILPKTNNTDTTYRIGHDILGPVLVPFVYAMLVRVGRSHRPGQITRIFYQARDGWFLQRIAEVLIQNDPRLKKLLDGVEHQYIRLSRLACLPAAGDAPPDVLSSFRKYLGIRATPRALGRLLGLQDADLLAHLSSQNLDVFLWNNPEAETLVAPFLNDPKLLTIIQQRQEESRNLLREYLLQEQFLCEKPQHVHLIDLGWMSTVQAALTRGFAEDPSFPLLTGHLLGNLLPQRTLDPQGRSRLEPGYCVDSAKPTSFDEAVIRGIALFEIACQERVGSTTGYQRQKNRIEAIAGPIPDTDLQFCQSIQNGVLECAKVIATNAKSHALEPNALFPNAINELVRFVRHPKKDEALAFQNVHFDVDIGTGIRIRCVDPTIGVRELFPPTRLHRRIRSVSWVEGSLVASQFPLGSLIHRLWLSARKLGMDG